MTDHVLFSLKHPLKCSRYFVLVCCFFCINFFSTLAAFAQYDPPFEETSVFLNVPGLGGKEVEALMKGEKLYLSVTDLFNYLEIKNDHSPQFDSVTGFFLNSNNNYLIDYKTRRIVLNGKTYLLNADDIVQTQMGLYLRSTIFGKIFGLDCIFNFRSLSVELNTKLELPAIRLKRQQLLRQNISKLKQEITPDTIIQNKYPAFNFGTADWTITTTHQKQEAANTMLSLRVGAIVAGGETDFTINYNYKEKINLKQQNYLWRHVNNDNETIRQVIVGKIPLQSTASLITPVVGVQITNAQTTFRRSFGTYTLSDFTEPAWVVELYINNILVEYTKADASGFYTFQVPMVYGNSILQLRFFGPGGEERTKEENIFVPSSFLPKNEFEYTMSAGMMEDNKQSRFSRVDMKYGLNSVLTIGSGVEYLSSVSSGTAMPFINAFFKPAANLILSGDYTYDVRAKAIISYRLPSDLTFELDYIKYKQGQQAINLNVLEERKAIISQQFKTRTSSVFTRLTIDNMVYANSKQTMADLLLSGTWKGIGSNLTTYAQFMNPGYLNIYSNLALALRLPGKISFRPQMQYGYSNKSINSVKLESEKQLFGNGYFNITYENNFITHTPGFSLGLRFDLSFVRASFSARRANNNVTYSQTLTGGIIYDGKTNYLNFNNRNNVGRGGLEVYPYLDLNANNQRDPGEPKIKGLELKINGGRVQSNVRDTTIQVFDLIPYTSYLVELNPNSFDNIAWQLKKSLFKVTIDPNKVKLLEIPVKVSGEVSGMVYGCSRDSIGQDRIVVNFYKGSRLVGKTITESDGDFSFLGLLPGAYTACVDPEQLNKLKMRAFPSSVPFKVKVKTDGDIVSNINFKLEQLIDKNATQTIGK
jgi:hypothetical protein